MTTKVGPGKRAHRHDLQLFLPGEGHGRLYELAANPSPFESRGHFGMNEDKTAIALLVRQERDAGVGVHFESFMRHVVAHVHG